MKRTLLIILAGVLLLVPVAVFAFGSSAAAASNADDFCIYGTNAEELTQQQQADLEESYQQMIELRKETIGKMVQNGLLTEEEGQRQQDWLDEMAAEHEEAGTIGFYGVRGGCYGRYGTLDEGDYYGRGGMMRYDDGLDGQD